jgi:hypothetical protein
MITELWPERAYAWQELVRLRLAEADVRGARAALEGPSTSSG